MSTDVRAQDTPALRRQAGRPIDLLLTDMVMPGGIMGDQLAESLLNRAPHLKVIYTSGYSPGMPGNNTTPFKGRNFLPKPYSVDKLVQFIRECLDSEPATN